MHFQDSLLCKWKQGEKRNCPYHGTCDNQRNYRTVQLQVERYQGYLWYSSQNIVSIKTQQGMIGGNLATWQLYSNKYTIYIIIINIFNYYFSCPRA